MIDISTSTDDRVIEVTVHGALEALDFDKATRIMDDTIGAQGEVKGLVLNISEFSGWENVSVLLKHLRFVREHHQYVVRVAAVGSHAWQQYLPRLVEHFVHAEPRYFDIQDIEEARTWASTGQDPS